MKKILFIDDEEYQRVSVRKFLSILGYQVYVFGNPEDALKILEKEEFDLIITDLEMPNMDGIEFCKRIREMNTGLVIYALSGHIAEFDPEKLEEIGFDGYLCKPVDTEKFEQAIEGAFDKINRQ